MTYHPPPPSEPNGCLQTLVISRIVFGILLIPMLLIFAALFGVMLFLFAFSTHPLLGLGVLVLIGLAIYGFARWEQHRVQGDHPDAKL
jgi:hypothetical protein